MDNSFKERVEDGIFRGYATQFTGSDHSTYQDLIHDTFPGPYVEIDCAAILDYDEFFVAMGPQLVTTLEEFYQPWMAVEDHFDAEKGTLVLYNFDELDSKTATDVAQYIKGLWEDQNHDSKREFAIAITTDDPDALYRGNGDLSGRVRTLNLANE